MRQRTALTIAMALTTFLLILAAAVIGRLAIAPASRGSTVAPATATAAASADGLSAEQEAEYQAALATANALLEQANRQLEDAYRRLTPEASSVPPPSAVASAAPEASASASTAASSLPAATTAPAGRISAEQAVAAARAYVGGGTVERVRLEEEQGQLVYEVRFTNKSRVYVDPRSGNVVYARLEDANESDD